MINFGLSAEEFTRQYLDSKPYLRRAALSSTLMAWSDLDQVLAIAETHPNAVQLFHNGQVAPPLFIEEGIEFGRTVMRLNKHRFYERLQTGATLVINQIEQYSLPARRLGLAVSQFTGMQTTSNAYASFGGSGSFGRHWDTHDVVVLQLLGRKHWQVFAPSWPLPLSSQTSERMQLACPSKPEFETTLETGDLLYIPRGWWHNVSPLQEGSLHLSVGVYAPAVIDYITWLCARYLPQQLHARELVTAGSRSKIPALLQAIATTALEESNVEEFNKDAHQRARLISEFNIARFVANDPELRDDTYLMLTAVGINAESSEIRINGGRIRLDEMGGRVIRTLSENVGMTFIALCNCMPTIKRDDVATVVMSLASHELINIDAAPRSTSSLV